MTNIFQPRNKRQRNSCSSLLMNKKKKKTAFFRSLCIVVILLCLSQYYLILSHHARHHEYFSSPSDPLPVTNNAVAIINNNDEKTRSENHLPNRSIILHMGPAKTGSTSIQEASDIFRKQLEQDGYFKPYNLLQEKEKDGNGIMKQKIKVAPCNQVNFATCFLPQTEPIVSIHSCIPELLQVAREQKQKNVFVSAETFGEVHTDGFQKLKTYLSSADDDGEEGSGWDEITIVVYYRHFYSWIVSCYYEIMSNIDKRRNVSINMNEFVQYLIIERHHFFHAAPLVKRLKQTFTNENTEIIVMDMHNKKDFGSSPSESFFCHALSNKTAETCKAIQNYNKQQQGGEDKVNERNEGSIDHFLLIRGALAKNLISMNDILLNTTQYEQKINQVRQKMDHLKFHEGIQFEKTCLEEDLLEKLWDLSLQYKHEIEPNILRGMYNNGKEKEETIIMREDFEKQAKTKFCVIDVDKALSMTILNEKEYLKKYFEFLVS